MMKNMRRLALLLLPLFAASALADDPFAKGGCYSLEELKAHQKTLSAQGLISMEGESLFLPIKENYHLVLGSYQADGKSRMMLTVRDKPNKRDATKACVIWFSEESRGVLVNPLAGEKPAESWMKGYDVQGARNACAKALPILMKRFQAREVFVGGTWMTSADELRAMRNVVGKDLAAEERNDAINDAANQGNTISPDSLAIYLPVDQRKTDLSGWSMFIVPSSDSAYLLGYGSEYEIVSAIFASKNK